MEIQLICWLINDFCAIDTYFIGLVNNFNTNMFDTGCSHMYCTIHWELPARATSPYGSLYWRSLLYHFAVSLLYPTHFRDMRACCMNALIKTCMLLYPVLQRCANIIATSYLFIFAFFWSLDNCIHRNLCKLLWCTQRREVPYGSQTVTSLFRDLSSNILNLQQ